MSKPERKTNELPEPIPRILDADRSFLEQFEEAACSTDEALRWLTSEIYERSDRMSVLDNVRDRKQS